MSKRAIRKRGSADVLRSSLLPYCSISGSNVSRSRRTGDDGTGGKTKTQKTKTQWLTPKTEGGFHRVAVWGFTPRVRRRGLDGLL
jgi:hypothetical protein